MKKIRKGIIIPCVIDKSKRETRRGSSSIPSVYKFLVEKLYREAKYNFQRRVCVKGVCLNSSAGFGVMTYC